MLMLSPLSETAYEQLISCQATRLLTGRMNLSISWDVKSVAGWSAVEDHVGNLAGWVGAGALLKWRWHGGGEAGESQDGCECELHGDGWLDFDRLSAFVELERKFVSDLCELGDGGWKTGLRWDVRLSYTLWQP